MIPLMIDMNWQRIVYSYDDVIRLSYTLISETILPPSDSRYHPLMPESFQELFLQNPKEKKKQEIN